MLEALQKGGEKSVRGGIILKTNISHQSKSFAFQNNPINSDWCVIWSVVCGGGGDGTQFLICFILQKEFTGDCTQKPLIVTVS